MSDDDGTAATFGLNPRKGLGDPTVPLEMALLDGVHVIATAGRERTLGSAPVTVVDGRLVIGDFEPADPEQAEDAFDVSRSGTVVIVESLYRMADAIRRARDNAAQLGPDTHEDPE